MGLVFALCQAPLLHAQKWNDVGADMILAQNFKRLVHRRNTLVSEGIDSFLPSHHTVLATLIVMNLMRDVLR